MGMSALLQEEQNPLRAIEHVRRLCANRHVFQTIIAKVFEVIEPLRREAQGEISIEGVFHPTSRAHVVRLDLSVLRRKRCGEVIAQRHANLYLCINDEGEVLGLIAHNVQA